MKWEKIIIVIVSAAFALILYIFLPVESNKYRLRIVEKKSYSGMFSVLHSDLNGDGNAEFIRCKKQIPVPAILTQKSHYQDVRQWNLNGEWLEYSSVDFTDLDHDGFKEIIAFTFYNDSVWIHIIEALQEGGMLLHKAIDRVQKYNGKQDWRVNLTTGNLNGDGNDVCILSIRSGYTLQPRSLYVLNPHNGEIRIPETEVWNAISIPLLVDMDRDGVPEITGSTTAPGNVKDPSAPYSDSCAWFMIYDQDLRFKLTPLPYFGSPSYLRMMALKEKERQLLLTLHFTRGHSGIANLLELWEWKNDSLVQVRSREFAFDDMMELVSVDPKGNGHFYIAAKNSLIKLNHLLEIEENKEVGDPGLRNSFYQLDVDGQGLSEQIVYSNFSKITIARNDFTHPVSLDLGYQSQRPVITGFTKNRTHFLNVYRGHESWLLGYSKNPLYPFRFLILVLSFLGYYVIFLLLFRFQRNRIEKRQASENQVLQYQLANVMQQLDPHFLFNALSNISSFYHKGEREHAQNYLSKLSKLIRSSLENSERMTISLTEELAFVEDYLYVEGIRMGDRFDYYIDVDEEVSAGVQIPKMLIQNFVENAMKHGVRHLKERKGLIRVYSSRVNDHLVISVEDNGVGRARASEIGSSGTGNGLIIVRKTLDTFEKLEKIKIRFEIEDLYGVNNEPSGTRVLLEIPVK